MDKGAFGILRIQHILSIYIPRFELFIDVVFKYATLPAAQGRLLGTITNYATGANEYSIYVIYFENVYSQTSFYIFFLIRLLVYVPNVSVLRML